MCVCVCVLSLSLSYCLFFKILESLLSFYLGIDAAITSTSPLPPFVPEEQVESSSSEAIPSLYPISPTIDFLKTNNYNLKNSIGQKEQSVNGIGTTTVAKYMYFDISNIFVKHLYMFKT